MLKIPLKSVVFSFAFILWLNPLFAEMPSGFTGMIKENNINVRADSTVGSPVICSLDKGERAEVVTELYEWYKIRLPKKAPSYVKKELLECVTFAPPVPSEGSVPPNTAGRCLSARVIKERINIRLEPNESSAILGKLNKEETVSVISEKGLWFKIEPSPKSFGWVHKKFVEKIPEAVLSPAQQPVLVKQQAPLKQEEGITLEGKIRRKVFTGVAAYKFIANDKKVYLIKESLEPLEAFIDCKVKVTAKLLSPASEKAPLLKIIKAEALKE